MKNTTFKKYENFLAACRKESVILNIRQLAKVHCVSVTFTDWLIKNRYLVKTTGGSYKYMASIKPYSEIVRMYENSNEPKQPKPYPTPIKMTTLEEHESEIIRLLKEIEFDHGVSYSLTRTETTKTVLL